MTLSSNPSRTPIGDVAMLLLITLCWGPIDVLGFMTNPRSFSVSSQILTNNNGKPWGMLPKSFVESNRYPIHQFPSRVIPRRTTVGQLNMVNFDSDDPFEVLGIEPTPDVDKKAVKRIYRRLALKYHPDVVTKQDSTDEQRADANRRFAKINWAYELLSGKTAFQKGEDPAGTTTKSNTGWEPPHRRKSAYSRTTSGTYSGGSADWRDYIPKDEDDEYDTDGDSFGAIFSDLIMGAAGAAAGRGRGGIFKDFVDFLENNVDGYSGTSEDESELRLLLQMGSVDEVGNEMEDTDLVVQQLTSKLSNVDDELVMLRAELGGRTRFSEKIELEEKIAELEARQKVVKGYIQKARKRLVKLQTRYKELIVGGADDRRGRSSGRSSYSSPSYSRNPPSHPPPSYSSSTAPSPTPSTSSGSNDDWKSQSFGSTGRSRGSSRRRRSARREPATNTQRPASSPASSGRTRREYNPAPSAPRSSPSPPSPTPYTEVPPHRRTYSSRQDKARLRELKVDEEFEKLKKDLGL